MSLPIKAFEQATDAFLSNPSQGTYQRYLNEFASAIYGKAEVHAMVMFEDIPELGGPCVRLNKMSMGNQSWFSFYTSEEKIASSPFDADFVNMPLDMVVELTLGDETVSGLIVNPSEGADASLSLDMIKACYDAAKKYKR